MPKLTEYKDMSPRAKAVVEGIAQARGIDPANINNVWKALARHPSVMERLAAEMKDAFAPGKLAPFGASRHLPHEVGEAGRGNLAVSIANQCDYCIASHIASARKKGMSDQMFRELMAVVGMANETNRLVAGYQVEIDPQFKT